MPSQMGGIMARICIITGGTSGIGKATADILKADGWDVVATGLTDAELAANPGARRLDVRDTEAVEALFQEFDALDGLVNAAGVGAVGEAMSQDAFDTTIDINLTGTFRCCRCAYPALLKSGGSIVNIASVLGFVSNISVPGYCASKAGVVNLTRSLGARWAREGVRVNAVAPGYVETPMTEHVRGDNDRNVQVMDRTKMERMGKPSEVGELIAWLLSDKASFVTGSTHIVDGGYLTT